MTTSIPPVDTHIANAASSLTGAGIANSSMPRPSRSRAQSISSDKPSTIGVHSLMSPPLSVSPGAAFIAASAASQIVTSDHDTHTQTWYDEAGIEPFDDTVLVSNGALQLANNFVDQLLFNILAVAKSTTLPNLRAAVVDVLKPKLAKDAINAADEELREYLGGTEMDDLARSAPEESPTDWDLELVWKRTRLRCMVYSSLGDMEEEDEDHYMEQEHLNGESDEVINEVVSPAVAIFLTSILEFTGEQILVVAGQAAFHRLRTKYEKQLQEDHQPASVVAERIIVEELDMERVALDRTFGRLWRAWKKRIRSPAEPNFSRTFSRSSSAYSSGVSFYNSNKHDSATDPRSMATSQDLGPTTESQESQPDGTQSELANKIEEDATVDPSALPLPDSDVEVTDSDEEESEDEDSLPVRPKSWIAFSDPVEAEKESAADYTPLKRALSLPSRRRPRRPLLFSIPDDAEIANETTEEDGADGANGQPAEEQIKPNSIDGEQASTLMGVEQDVVGRDVVEEEVADDVGSTEEAPQEASGLVEKVTSGAVAVGAAAVAGLTTLATGIAPQTQLYDEESDIEEGQEADSEAEAMVEEPEIINVSRISIDRRSSPAITDQVRPSSIIHTRSSSVQSARVVDVQGPRSPSIRSRASSVEAETTYAAHSQSASISREGSVSRLSRTPPIAEEQDAYVTPSVMVTNAASEGVPHRSDESRSSGSGMLAPSIQARSQSRSTTTAVLSYTSAPAGVENSTSASALAPEERHESVSRSSTGLKHPPMPTLPERSASRPTYVQTNPLSRASPVSPDSPKLPRPMQSESPSSSRFKPIRTSEDSASIRPADVARNFEELIQSNETLQYTLTPENMRNIDSPTGREGSPKISHAPRMSDDIKTAERSRSSSIKRTVSLSKSTGLGSHPPSDMASHGKNPNAGSRAAPPVSMRNNNNNNNNRAGPSQLARDARVPRESTQDFADFIRLTGPPGSHGSRPNRAFTGGSGPGTMPPPPPKATSMEGRRVPRLQARDAIVTTSNESSELIDFIRRGPPSTNAVSHRIPRTVAPFRNTQDSELMTSAVGGRAVDAVIPTVRSSQASTNVTESSAPSSMNSQSALLTKSKQQQLYSANSFDDDDMMPKRTRRRVKDPYAIDFSDEDDDDFDVAPPRPPPNKTSIKKEETLAEFLNNYPPPPEPAPQPIVPPKKKSSAPNLIARLRSGSSNGSVSSSHGRKGSLLADSRSSNSRGGPKTGHTPIVVPTSTGGYGAAQGAPASAPAHAVPGWRGAPARRFEARDPTSLNSQTSDLARFLRESQPPPSPAAVTSPSDDKPGSGFSRMFERRKKSTAY